jgi:hemerythrin
MSDLPRLPTRTPPASGSDAIDAEHGIQLGLIEAALGALTAGSDSAGELVEQLHLYTQAHFMSEQLLMRLHARANYHGHLDEHEALMQDLDSVRMHLANGDHASAAAELQAHEERLLGHIRSWDRSLDGEEASRDG